MLSDLTQLRKRVPYPVVTTARACSCSEPCDERAAQSQNVEEAFGCDYAVPRPHMLHACTKGRRFAHDDEDSALSRAAVIEGLRSMREPALQGATRQDRLHCWGALIRADQPRHVHRCVTGSGRAGL